MGKALLIGGLSYHDESTIPGMIECKCKVGDGWQGITRARLADYLYDDDTPTVVGEVDCRLGAHVSEPGRSGWWLILTVPVSLVPDVAEQAEVEAFVRARESR